MKLKISYFFAFLHYFVKIRTFLYLQIPSSSNFSIWKCNLVKKWYNFLFLPPTGKIIHLVKKINFWIEKCGKELNCSWEKFAMSWITVDLKINFHKIGPFCQPRSFMGLNQVQNVFDFAKFSLINFLTDLSRLLFQHIFRTSNKFCKTEHLGFTRKDFFFLLFHYVGIQIIYRENNPMLLYSKPIFFYSEVLKKQKYIIFKITRNEIKNR